MDIYENLFSNRRNNAGGILLQQWVFGWVRREPLERLLVEGPDRGVETGVSRVTVGLRKVEE